MRVASVSVALTSSGVLLGGRDAARCRLDDLVELRDASPRCCLPSGGLRRPSLNIVAGLARALAIV